MNHQDQDSKNKGRGAGNRSYDHAPHHPAPDENNNEHRKMDETLKQDKDFIETVLDTMGNLLLVLNPRGQVIRFNRALGELTGYTELEVKGHYYWDVFLHPEEIELAKAFFAELTPEDLPFSIENYWLTRHGDSLLILWTNTAVLDDEGAIKYFVWTGADITERKMFEETLRETNERLSTLIQASPLAVISLDEQGRVNSWSSAAESLFGWAEREVLDETPPMIPPEELDGFENLYRDVMKGKSYTGMEVCYLKKNGDPLYVSLSTAPLRNNIGDVKGIMMVALDVTERRKAEEKIRYLSFHDTVTGLYNRAYFEEELRRLDTPRQFPLSLIMADVNGLKLVNDAFGHQEGDKLLLRAAQVLKDTTRQEDIVCRWGGDEFAILLPKTNRHDVEVILERIKSACKDIKPEPIEMSIALGCATKTEAVYPVEDLIKKAEAEMYSHKISEAKKFRMLVISSLLISLSKKSFENEQHIWRMQALAINLGEALNLDDSTMEDLVLAVALHDIGKLAVPEEILLKPGSLSKEEWTLIREHSERGFHIAQSSVELAQVAGIILSHHEHWDGSGYPQGLAGEEIPQLSRLLSIIDAYDVMTNDQVYRKAVSPAEALAEIERCSGSQFDPRIAGVFVTMMHDLHEQGESIINPEQESYFLDYQGREGGTRS